MSRKNKNIVEVKIKIKRFEFNIEIFNYDSIVKIKTEKQAQDWVLKNIHEKISIVPEKA